jgi:Rrf2 family protein
MISQTAEYALRAVVCLAQNPEKPLTNVEIARLTKVPEHYLSKVLHALVKGGIVRSQRGLHGVYILTQAIDQLPLLDIINTVDPMRQIESCPLKLGAHGTNLCALHKRINHSMKLMEEVFKNSTVQTILDERSESIPLCES